MSNNNNYTLVFEFALVELFGHNRIVGQVGEQEIGGETFLRVDVPEVEGEQAFTKLYGKGAIYAITPVGELTAKAMLRGLKPVPFRPYEFGLSPQRMDYLAASNDGDDDDDDDGGVPF